MLLEHLKSIESKLDALLVNGGSSDSSFTQVLVSLRGEFKNVIDKFGGSQSSIDQEELISKIESVIDQAMRVETVPSHDRPKIKLFVGVFVGPLSLQYDHLL